MLNFFILSSNVIDKLLCTGQLICEARILVLCFGLYLANKETQILLNGRKE